MWVDADDEQILINTEIHRAKYKAIQQHPEVTVTIWDAANPYRYAEVRGKGHRRGPRRRRPGPHRHPSQRYLGHDYGATIQSERVVAADRARPPARRAGCEHGPPLVARRDGLGQRLADDARGGRRARALRRRPRGRGRQRPPDARRDVRLRRGGAGARPAGDHRRRRRRGPPARDAGGQDDRAGARRAGAVAPPAGPGLAAVDRADAGRRAGGHVRHRRGRGDERGAVRGRPAAADDDDLAAALARRSGRPPRPGRVVDVAARRRDRADRPAGDHRRARRRPARPLHRRRGPADGLRHGRARAGSRRPAGAVADVHVVAPTTTRTRSTGWPATCAVVTTEFENPPAAALERLAGDVVVAPGAGAVAIAQDRLRREGVPRASRRARRRRGCDGGDAGAAASRRSSRRRASATTARARSPSTTRPSCAAALAALGVRVRRRAAGAARRRGQRRRRPHAPTGARRRTRSPRTTTPTASST